MKKLIIAASVLTSFVSVAALARGVESDVSAYYHNEDVEGTTADGVGLAGRFIVPAGQGGVLLPVEYNILSADDGDLDELRIGAGYAFKLTPVVSLEGSARYVSLDFDGFKIDGPAGYLGIRANVASNVKLYGEIGYQDLEDSDGDTANGLELTVGAAIDFRGPGLFAEFRRQTIDYGSDFGESDLDSFRVGARYSF